MFKNFHNSLNSF